jgi:hypothetical protein
LTAAIARRTSFQAERRLEAGGFIFFVGDELDIGLIVGAENNLLVKISK